MNPTRKWDYINYYSICNTLLSTKFLKLEGDLAMFEDFEKNLSQYFYNMTYYWLQELMKTNEKYKRLFNENINLIEKLRNDTETDILEKYIDNSAQIHAIENEFLYKQGNKDCAKLFKYLNNDMSYQK